MEIDYLEIKDEVWKALPTNRKYAVSSLGRVASAAHGTSIRVMSINDNGKGYKLVSIGKVNRKNFYIHRLVATAFIDNPENKAEVNHIDGDKSNNRVKNLEWVTLQENRDHSKTTGLTRRGSKHPHAKLTEDSVREIKQIIAANPKINKTELGRRFGVRFNSIDKISKGKLWTHVKAS